MDPVARNVSSSVHANFILYSILAITAYLESQVHAEVLRPCIRICSLAMMADPPSDQTRMNAVGFDVFCVNTCTHA